MNIVPYWKLNWVKLIFIHLFTGRSVFPCSRIFAFLFFKLISNLCARSGPTLIKYSNLIEQLSIKLLLSIPLQVETFWLFSMRICTGPNSDCVAHCLMLLFTTRADGFVSLCYREVECSRIYKWLLINETIELCRVELQCDEVWVLALFQMIWMLGYEIREIQQIPKMHTTADPHNTQNYYKTYSFIFIVIARHKLLALYNLSQKFTFHSRFLFVLWKKNKFETLNLLWCEWATYKLTKTMVSH